MSGPRSNRAMDSKGVIYPVDESIHLDNVTIEFTSDMPYDMERCLGMQEMRYFAGGKEQIISLQ